MKSNIIYNRLNLKIGKGGKNFSERLNIEKGVCVGVRFIPFSQEPVFNIDLSLQDAQGTTIITATDFRNWKHAGGGFMQGFLQTNFETDNNSFLITAEAKQELEEDFLGQIIFVIEKI